MRDFTEDVKQRVKARNEPKQALLAIDLELYGSVLPYNPDRTETIRALKSNVAESARQLEVAEDALEKALNQIAELAALMREHGADSVGNLIVQRNNAIKERDFFSANANAYQRKCDDLEAARDKALSELAYVRLQRDALLEITWLDLPGEPHESIARWREEFQKGWERK